VGLERVAGDDLQPARPVRGNFLQGAEAARVALDRDHALRAMCQQRPRQAPWPGADLDHRRLLQRSGGASDLAGEVEVEQEVLAELFAGAQPEALDHLTQRRQAVAAHAGAISRAAISPAIFSAAIRLSGRALPVPAMSKAVPWSGEVRMKGRPSVTLTAVSKASVLAGISAWS